jgi:uncharacterized protein YdiU (UPF0061 family)
MLAVKLECYRNNLLDIMNQFDWKFENSYQTLPSILFESVDPQPVKEPQGILFNEQLAHSINIDIASLTTDDGIATLSGNQLPEDAKPISQAYSGHQFGNFTNLGDGRAILLGEHRVSNEKVVDIQLKGCGRTPYSRSGDGFATLGSLLKEYLYGEVMHALGIPTTRSLAIIGAGELVQRQRLHPRAVMTRVASSHLRIGTFEFATQYGVETLKELTDYAIQRHFPDLVNVDNCYFKFLEQFLDQQAYLTAQWMSVGFVHGVMNTDNISMAGETIDYGPCAFIDEYDPKATFSSIDRMGRYAYGNQPKIMYWNICRFAEALLPLLSPSDPNLVIQETESILRKFPDIYAGYWQKLFCKKIGFTSAAPNVVNLVNDLLKIMHAQRADFTATFRQLASGSLNSSPFKEWELSWRSELGVSGRDLMDACQLMLQVNPMVIPRNHVVASIIDEVEISGNINPFLDLLKVLENPFSAEHGHHPLASPRPAGTPRTVTYCGT